MAGYVQSVQDIRLWPPGVQTVQEVRLWLASADGTGVQPVASRCTNTRVGRQVVASRSTESGKIGIFISPNNMQDISS